MATNNNYKDITKTGPKALRGIRNPDLYTTKDNPISLGLSDIEKQGLRDEANRAIYRNYNTAHGHIGYEGLSNPSLYAPVPVSPESGLSEYGESRYDEGILYNPTPEDIQNQRAYNQPWYAKVAAGIGKGAVIAATTFADGVIGTLAGIGNILANTEDIDSLEDVGDKFINNPLSTVLQDINALSEEALPNYYSTEEQNTPWYNNIFSANFIGDKFLKNLGFTIGAAYSGRVSAGLIGKAMGLQKVRDAFKGVVTTASGKELKTASEIAKAYKTGDAFMDGVKITEDLGKAAKRLKNAEYGLRTLGAVNAAMGEGRIEAISNSEEWFNYNKKLIDDNRTESLRALEVQLFQEHPEWFSLSMAGDGRAVRTISPEGQRELQRRAQEVTNQYNQALAKLSSDRAKMANRIFAANVALLSASNLYTYGRFLSGGYNAGRQAKNLVTGSLKEGYQINKNIAKKQLAKSLSIPFTEMNEEMSQAAIAEATGLKYASELNNFYGAKINPDAEEQTIDWINAIGSGIANTYGNSDRWEEGFLGFITGGLGMPHISMKTNESGKRRPKLTMEGELWEGLKDYRNTKKETADITSSINDRIKDSRLSNYYQGMIRHNTYQNGIDESLNKGDKFSFENSKHSQFISDAIMFDKAGRLQDLYDTIEEAGNVTLDDVDAIREQTTKTDGSKSIYEGMTDEMVVETINKQAKEAKDKLDKYVEISNNLKTLYGDNISSDTLEELTWMMTQLDDWESRTKSIIGDIKNTISKKATELNNRFGLDISSELGNLETMLEQVSKKDNVIDQINKIINDKNLSISEGRARIEELIKAKDIERSTSGLRLGHEIQHIRKIARERREALKRQFNEEQRRLDLVRTYNEEDKRKAYDYYLKELERISSEMSKFYTQNDHYSNLKIDDLRIQAIEAFENYATISKDMDTALEYAEDFMLNRMITQLSPYEGFRGKSAFEKSREAFARNRQKELSSSLFSQIVALKEMLETDEYKTIDPLSIKDLGEKFSDLIKLYAVRAKFIDKYTQLSEHPELFTEEAQKNLKEVIEHIKSKEIETTLDNLGDISSVNDLKKSLNEIDEDLVEEVLSRLASKGDAEKKIVNDYNKLNDYTKSLSEVIGTIPPEEGDLAVSLITIVKAAYEDANSVDDMKAELENAKSQIPANISKSLENLMLKAEKNNKSRKSAKTKDKNKPKQKVKKAKGFSISEDLKDDISQLDREDLEDTEDTKSSSRKKSKVIKSDSPEIEEIENKSDEELEEITKGNIPQNIPNEDKPKVKKLADKILKNRRIPEGESQAEGTNSEDNNPKTKESITPYLRSWYHTKYRFDELKDRDIRRAERYDSPVVDALDELGAYDFVDEGYLGILFNQNPDIPIHYVRSKDSRLNNVIILAIEVSDNINSSIPTTNSFIAQDGKKYQAVGALGFPKDNTIAQKGYERIASKFNKEISSYLKSNSEPDYFVSKEQSNKIQHIYSGRMVKTTNQDAPKQKSLKNVVGSNPILGVYYGNSSTPRTPMLDSEEEIVPLNSNNANPRDGSVWLISREADGRWYSKAVQVRRFTAEEYDIDEHYDTPIMQAIIQDLKIIADSSKSDYDRAIAKYDLMNILYFPEGTGIGFNGSKVVINGVNSNIDKDLTLDEKVQILLENLQDESLNLRFQVDPNSLSERLYVKDLLTSDIMTTDLAISHNVNASFDLFIPDEDGVIQDSDINPRGHTGKKGINNAIKSRTVFLNGKKYSITDEEVLDNEGNIVENSKTLDELKLMQQIEDKEINPIEGSNRLYIGTYSSLNGSAQFGISGGHVFTGDKLEEMLKAIQDKKEKKARKAKVSDIYDKMFEHASEEGSFLGYEIEGEPSKKEDIEYSTDSLLKLFSSEAPSQEDIEEKPKSQFKVGDKVSYKTSGGSGVGEITRINSKGTMVYVTREDGKEVGYMTKLIKKIEEKEESESNESSMFSMEQGSDEDMKSLLKALGIEGTSNEEDVNQETNKQLLEEEIKEPEEEPIKPKKKVPLSIGNTFNKKNTMSLKELEWNKNHPDFSKLARVNMKALSDLGFTTISEFKNYVENPENELPSIETITSQEQFEALIDTIKNCRK